MIRSLPAVAVSLALAACGAPPDDPPLPMAQQAPAPQEVAPPAMVEPGVVGEAAAALVEGELRCSWSDEDGGVRLLAGANVGADVGITGAIVLDGSPVALRSEAAGGFGALERGPTLAGGGVTAAVERGERIETGTEEGRFRATLRLDSDGAQWSGPGIWSCGP